MARLDDLVAQVKDARLRREMLDALTELKRRQNFGLVFEEHIPETTALYGLPLKVGAIVQRRNDDQDSTLYRLAGFTSQRREASLAPLDGGDDVSVPVKDLLIVKRFGEAMYAALTSLG